MQMTGIEAYEGHWEGNIVPIKGAAYRITTTSELDEGLHQDIWFTFKSVYTFEGYLYQGDVIESGPVSGVQSTERIILFKVKDIMPLKNMLVSFPESEYPQELDNEFKELLEGCGWFGNKLIIKKNATDNYDLTIDFYGNVTNIIVTEYEGKMYCWLTRTGFALYKYYFGKYVLPAWLKSLIDHPEENGLVRYYDIDEEW
ncbi:MULTISPECIES: hypothetical protein [Niastella]|uniref:YopX protein domain-containing protein n=1 Tax=Niastella soli TaxID=2821487 RepID=A0ABS3YXT9_9BACT|nr:hypothetical protein [Niastella soli]MBO9202683.1 hypothetical protein [Niastella soli]